LELCQAITDKGADYRPAAAKQPPPSGQITMYVLRWPQPLTPTVYSKRCTP
jgi:hypothetical protein